MDGAILFCQQEIVKKNSYRQQRKRIKSYSQDHNSININKIWGKLWKLQNDSFFYRRGSCVTKLSFVDPAKRKLICFVLYLFRFPFKSLGLIVLCECIVGFSKIKHSGGNKKSLQESYFMNVLLCQFLIKARISPPRAIGYPYPGFYDAGGGWGKLKLTSVLNRCNLNLSK